MQNLTLSKPDSERFEQLKQTISDGLATVFAVGAALREVKEKKLYRADGFDDFESWRNHTWPHLSPRYANALIVDARIINALPNDLRKLVTSHAAAQELSKVPEELRPSVLQAIAPPEREEPVTAEEIKKATPSRVPKRKKSKVPVSSKKPEKPKGPKDKTGIEVPRECLKLWERAGDAVELITYIKSIISKLKKYQDRDDPLFAEVNFGEVLALLNQVEASLQTAIPYAVCPDCNGVDFEKCRTCKKRGLVSEFFWNHAVDADKKKLREK